MVWVGFDGFRNMPEWYKYAFWTIAAKLSDVIDVFWGHIDVP